ncbi:hypothetical protein HY407_03300 [Candidatus Gottesmanbacteria bacterium]|nr:hypothetical protein [Candidatus Gottesmanbacteria bacterium]
MSLRERLARSMGLNKPIFEEFSGGIAKRGYADGGELGEMEYTLYLGFADGFRDGLIKEIPTNIQRGFDRLRNSVGSSRSSMEPLSPQEIDDMRDFLTSRGIKNILGRNEE